MHFLEVFAIKLHIALQFLLEVAIKPRPLLVQCAWSVTGGLRMQDSRRIPQKNRNAWWFKLIACPSSAINFEIVSLSLSEIWQPWYANFGNPEIQIMVSGSFYYVYAKSKVDFDFQGCHLFSNILILCLYGNPELKFSFSPCLNLKLLNYMLFIQNLFKKPKIYFYSST